MTSHTNIVNGAYSRCCTSTNFCATCLRLRRHVTDVLGTSRYTYRGLGCVPEAVNIISTTGWFKSGDIVAAPSHKEYFHRVKIDCCTFGTFRRDSSWPSDSQTRVLARKRHSGITRKAVGSQGHQWGSDPEVPLFGYIEACIVGYTVLSHTFAALGQPRVRKEISHFRRHTRFRGIADALFWKEPTTLHNLHQKQNNLQLTKRFALPSALDPSALVHHLPATLCNASAGGFFTQCIT